MADLMAAFEAAAREFINPGGIRVGDRVRTVSTVTGLVTTVQPDLIVVDKIGFRLSTDGKIGNRTWELLDRPKPEARLGSVWVDPYTDDRWIAFPEGEYMRAEPDKAHISVEASVSPEDAALIARLVPAEGEA